MEIEFRRKNKPCKSLFQNSFFQNIYRVWETTSLATIKLVIKTTKNVEGVKVLPNFGGIR